MVIPSFNDLIPVENHIDTFRRLDTMVKKAAYDLIKTIDTRDSNKWTTNNIYSGLQIATAESLTGGLIMSSLVDIPFGGYIKYGGFVVYNTDAKRSFINVSVGDVYTHKCAKEMAIGILKNSSSSLGIAVTGNAMPLNHEVDRLGEVFIGIAGYNESGNIIYITQDINGCIDNNSCEFKKLCKKWYGVIKNEGRYNDRKDTATISKEIRLYTTYKALELCVSFINEYNPVTPDFIINRKEVNELSNINNNHTNIPSSKYNSISKELCLKSCLYSNNNNRIRINTIDDIDNLNTDKSCS